MKLNFSASLLETLIKPSFASAGPSTQEVYSRMEWEKCSFELLDIDGIKIESTTDLDMHVVPHLGGPGVFRTPDNISALASKIDLNSWSFLARDFAMPTPHPQVSARAICFDGAPHYVFNKSRDDLKVLKDAIRFATSWTFLGFAFSSPEITSELLVQPAQMRKKLIAVVMNACAGDTYLIAHKVAWKDPN